MSQVRRGRGGERGVGRALMYVKKTGERDRLDRMKAGGGPTGGLCICYSQLCARVCGSGEDNRIKIKMQYARDEKKTKKKRGDSCVHSRCAYSSSFSLEGRGNYLLFVAASSLPSVGCGVGSRVRSTIWRFASFLNTPVHREAKSTTPAPPAATPYNMKTPRHTPDLPCAYSRRRAGSREDSKTGRVHHAHKTKQDQTRRAAVAAFLCRHMPSPASPTDHKHSDSPIKPPSLPLLFFFFFIAAAAATALWRRRRRRLCRRRRSFCSSGPLLVVVVVTVYM